MTDRERLRELPDGSLTREEVNALLDDLAAAEERVRVLDVERLAQALRSQSWEGEPRSIVLAGNSFDEIAECIAAEYAALGAAQEKGEAGS